MSRKLIYRCNQKQNVLWIRAAVGRDQDTPLLISLLIDTGASYTVLPIPILKRLGCNLNQPLENKKIVTANGAITIPIVTVP